MRIRQTGNGALETLLAQPASKVPVPAITVKLEKGIVNISSPDQKVGQITDWKSFGTLQS